jgi:RND family efflux transporter MFP subunit
MAFTERSAPNLLTRYRWVVIGVAALAVGAWFYERSTRPTPVAVTAAREGAAERVLAITGRTRPQVTVTIVPKVAGQIVRLTKEEGDAVKQGELLVQLDADAPRAAVDQAQSAIVAQRRAVAEAERNFERISQIRARGLTTQQEFDEARFDLDQSRAELTRLTAALRETSTRLADTMITAPVSGVVLSRPVDGGQVVSTQSVIYEIAPLSGVEVEADVDEAFLAEVTEGLRADVLVAGRADPIPATLHYVAPKVDPRTGGAKVRLRLDGEADGLRAGVTADVNLVVEQRPSALTVERSAILGRDDEARVLVVRDGRVEPRAVRFVDWPSERVIIESGLAAGEQVVAQPRPDLIGERVAPISAVGSGRGASLAHAASGGGRRAL